MIRHSSDKWWSLGLLSIALLVSGLHQNGASDAPPTSVPPSKDPGQPERGNYTVTSSNGTVCLLARMGLQLNITFTSASQNKTVRDVMNIQPNVTKSSGSCGTDGASLLLSADGEKTNLMFFFSLNTTSSKYHLSGVSLSVILPDISQPFKASNASLDYLKATLGRSYVCHAEQTLHVSENFSFNIFQLQVQPFGLTGDQFGTAEECQLDQDDMLIPIIVGAALAGLILVVLVAYLIGRKRSHAGYQTI